MNVAQIVGWSGAGKTTLVVALIRLYLARGLTVGAIKHTHHPLNERNEGDTARFLAAGANPVMLAGENEAIIATRRIRYQSPSELLAQFDTDVVVIEGFKQFTGWPRTEVSRDDRPDADDVALILDRIWHSRP